MQAKDILETMKAEIEEGIEVLRPRYPGRAEATLRWLAELAAALLPEGTLADSRGNRRETQASRRI